MLLKDKIKFLQKSLNLTDHAFCKRYKINFVSFKKWMEDNLNPDKEDLRLICKEFNLDLDDFVNNNSTLSSQVNEGEHPCKTIPIKDNGSLIYEDFAREDNSRYEEKD